MNQDEMIARVVQLVFDGSELIAIDQPCFERLLTLVAEKTAAKERERLFGKERDGDMRLMLHRWDGGSCWAEVTHFTAAQARLGPSDMLGRAAERMSAEIDATIRARAEKGGV